MKQLKSFWFALAILTVFMIGFGCTENEADRVATKIAAVHDTIKTVITDEAVIAQIPSDTLKKLTDLEDKYQIARQEYLATKATNSENNWSLLKEMVSYGSSLVTIIKELPCVSKYSTEIALAQTTLETIIKLFS